MGATVSDLKRAIRTIPDFPEPGVQFKDFTPLLARPDLMKRATEVLTAPFTDMGITKVLGIESRGFILGPLLAQKLDSGFVPVRKEGKLPHSTIQQPYDLEYGTDVIEMHVDGLGPDDCALVHDDVMATGGTAAAACALVRRTGATLAGVSLLIELDALNGRDHLPSDVSAHAVLSL